MNEDGAKRYTLRLVNADIAALERLKKFTENTTEAGAFKQAIRKYIPMVNKIEELKEENNRLKDSLRKYQKAGESL
jgi:cell shape-determining protein MreC